MKDILQAEGSRNKEAMLGKKVDWLLEGYISLGDKRGLSDRLSNYCWSGNSLLAGFRFYFWKSQN